MIGRNRPKECRGTFRVVPFILSPGTSKDKHFNTLEPSNLSTYAREPSGLRGGGSDKQRV